MSVTLFFLVAIGLVAVTWSLCFVGCGFPTSGLPGGPSTPYSNVVLGNNNIIAYWPLNDAQGGSGTLITSGNLMNSSSFGTAHDVTLHGHDGTYIAPPAYPNPPIASSSTISGTPTVGPSGSSIVPGDTGSGDMVANPDSVALGGGYVSIPWSAQSPSLAQFSVEAWIAPQGWVNGMGLTHVLFGALAVDGSGNASGFVIGVDNSVDPGNNLLQIVWGDGTPTTKTFTSTQVIIDPSVTTYVGVSGDASASGGTFNFFANGQDGSQLVDSVIATGYVAIDPTDPTLQVTFFIGAGRNAQAPRTNAGDVNGSPEFPFVGQMQSVALYSTVFQTGDFSSNFSAGSGG